jgi:hypothetical protein
VAYFEAVTLKYLLLLDNFEKENDLTNIGFEVLTAAVMTVTIFWDMATFSP